MTTQSTRAGLLCGAIGLAALLAACGADSEAVGVDVSHREGGGSATSQAADSTEQPSARSSAPDRTTASPKTQASKNVDLSEVAERNFHITYDTTGVPHDPMTMVIDGKKYVTITPKGKVIETPDTTLVCTKRLEICVKLPADARPGDARGTPRATELDTIKKNGKQTGSQKVLGITTDCYTVNGSTLGPAYTGAAQVCLHPDTGAPLAWAAKTIKGTDVTFTAIEFHAPTAKDFKPTWPVRTTVDPAPGEL